MELNSFDLNSWDFLPITDTAQTHFFLDANKNTLFNFKRETFILGQNFANRRLILELKSLLVYFCLFPNTP